LYQLLPICSSTSCLVLVNIEEQRSETESLVGLRKGGGIHTLLTQYTKSEESLVGIMQTLLDTDVS
jgi:hypothetical protein